MRGGRVVVLLLSVCGLVFVGGALLLFLFPSLPAGTFDWQESGPLLAGLVVTLLCGEHLIRNQLPRAESRRSPAL